MRGGSSSAIRNPALTWLTERAGSLRADYQARLAAHRALIRGFARQRRLVLRRPSHRPAGRRGAALPAEPALRRRLLRRASAAHGDRHGAAGGMIGALGFLSPWLLVALAALPLIWLILRLTPPRPRQVEFPADAAPDRARGPRAHAGADAVVADADPACSSSR